MKLKISILTIIVLVTYSIAFSQQSAMERLDIELSQQFEEMITADYNLRYDSLSPGFKARLSDVLLETKTIDFSFDSLSAKIRIIPSADGNFKTYSWDEKSGGSWHDMAAIVQFKTAEGQVKVKQLDSGEEGMTGAYTDVIIYEVHELLIAEKKHYLIIGWGTHGSGHHHSMIQVLRIEESELVTCGRCLEDQESLTVVAARRDKINLQFHPESLEITHNEFEYEEEMGFYRPTGQLITLKLMEGVFRVQ